jgi:hypothetical protein
MSRVLPGLKSLWHRVEFRYSFIKLVISSQSLKMLLEIIHILTLH